MTKLLKSTTALTASALVIGAVAAGVALSQPAAAQETDITVVSWGGAYSMSQQKAYLDPYMEEHPEINFINDDGSANALASLRAQAQAGNVTWDLVDMLPSDAQLACDEGLLLEIDHDEMLAAAPDGTPASEDFVDGSLGDCFIPQIVYSTVVAYNASMFPEDSQPESIDDFFNVEEFPGMRAIQNRPAGNLEWALYADGVAIEDIYDTLRTDEGVERALAKLDSIKDHLIFWSEGAQPPQLLADQEAAFATGYNGRIFAAAVEEDQPFEIIWDGQLVEYDGWVIPRDGRNQEAILEFLYWGTDTQRLADQAQYISYGPARESSQDLVGQHYQAGIDMGPHMPTHPDNFFAPITLNNEFWTNYGDQLRERYSNWMLN